MLTLTCDQSLFGFNIPMLKDDTGHIIRREVPRYYEHNTVAATERLIAWAANNNYTIKGRYN